MSFVFLDECMGATTWLLPDSCHSLLPLLLHISSEGSNIVEIVKRRPFCRHSLLLGGKNGRAGQVRDALSVSVVAVVVYVDTRGVGASSLK